MANRGELLELLLKDFQVEERDVAVCLKYT